VLTSAFRSIEAPYWELRPKPFSSMTSAKAAILPDYFYPSGVTAVKANRPLPNGTLRPFVGCCVKKGWIKLSVNISHLSSLYACQQAARRVNWIASTANPCRHSYDDHRHNRFFLGIEFLWGSSLFGDRGCVDRSVQAWLSS
jgi:hypothetical protein